MVIRYDRQRKKTLEQRRETMIKIVPSSPAYELNNIRCKITSSQRFPNIKSRGIKKIHMNYTKEQIEQFANERINKLMNNEYILEGNTPSDEFFHFEEVIDKEN